MSSLDDCILESESETSTETTSLGEIKFQFHSQPYQSEEMLKSCQSEIKGSITWKTFCENFPNLNYEQWYTHHSFNRYWKQYSKVMSWYKKHLTVTRNLQVKFGPYPFPLSHDQPFAPYNPNQINQGYPTCGNPQELWARHYCQSYSNSLNIGKPHDIIVKKSNKHERKRKKPNKRKLHDSPTASETSRDRNYNRKRDSETSTLTMVTENNESNMDFEITDEMLDFFAHSEKHRKERDAQKKLESEQFPEKIRTNIDEVKDQDKPRTVEAPKEQPGKRRIAEMKELYGKGAAMIHGMETALQMTYDRNIDIKKPRMWPNMPFNVQFA